MALHLEKKYLSVLSATCSSFQQSLVIPHAQINTVELVLYSGKLSHLYETL